MTVKQKQCLLAYLGYYDGEIDGVWGASSKSATAMFQSACGLSVDGIAGPITMEALKNAVANGEFASEPQEDSWDSVRYFKRSEFACKCGHCGGYPVEPDWGLLEVLDKIREHFGAPVKVISGIRCPDHNRVVDGAAKSQHLYGTAADIKIAGVAPTEVARYAETLLPKTGGIGIYSKFTHVDVRKSKSRWNG